MLRVRISRRSRIPNVWAIGSSDSPFSNNSYFCNGILRFPPSILNMPRKKISQFPIEKLIHIVRDERVILDADLAAIYDVTTQRLMQQYRRNKRKFPSDFAYLLTGQEVTNLKLQNAFSSWGGRRTPPVAFTEHGAIMAATILNSEQAVVMSVFVARDFVKFRELLLTGQAAEAKLDRIRKNSPADSMGTKSRSTSSSTNCTPFYRFGQQRANGLDFNYLPEKFERCFNCDQKVFHKIAFLTPLPKLCCFRHLSGTRFCYKYA